MAKFLITIVFIVLALAPFAAELHLGENTTNLITNFLAIENYEFNAKTYTIYLIALALLYWFATQLLKSIKKILLIILVAVIVMAAYLYLF